MTVVELFEIVFGNFIVKVFVFMDFIGKILMDWNFICGYLITLYSIIYIYIYIIVYYF